MARMTKVDVARGKAIITGSKRDWAEVARQERMEEYVARVVAEAPPLTDEQRDRIAGLLRRSQ